RSCCPSPVLLPPLPPPSATLFPYTTLFRSIEGGLVTQDATSAAQRRAPERAAGASHRGDQRPPGQDQEAPGRRLRVLGEGLHHRGKPPRHVGSVVAVPDRRVQLDQAVALLGD